MAKTIGAGRKPCPINKGDKTMAELIINHQEMTVFVDDFKGFTPDWDEIILPFDRKAVQALEELGYKIFYGHDDI